MTSLGLARVPRAAGRRRIEADQGQGTDDVSGFVGPATGRAGTHLEEPR